MPISENFTKASGGYSQPSRGDVHINQPLSNISIAYMQAADNFVASKVFPSIPVEKQSDAFYVYPRGDWNRSFMQERGPSTEAPRGTYEISNELYFAKVYAGARLVADQIRANQDAAIDLDREAVEFLTHQGLLIREIRWAENFFRDSQWTFQLNGAGSRAGTVDPASGTATNRNVLRWSDADSTPIEDVRLLKRTVLGETGFMPNTLTLGRSVFDTLIDHPDIVGRFDRGQTEGGALAGDESAQRMQLAALLGVSEVWVMDAIQNTANEGATDAHSFIGGDHALLSYKPSTPGLMTPSAGYTFAWTGYEGASVEGSWIFKYRNDETRSDVIENEVAFDHKQIAPDLGAFFNSII